MKIVTIPAEEKMLNELISQARQGGLILETAEGQRVVLVSLERWEGFEVGSGDDFEREVELTQQNEELLKLLVERRNQAERTSLAEVKEQLGLE